MFAKPFQAAITESDLKGIMPCYCAVNGEDVSASHNMLTKLLREKMGFDGMCISDYGAVGNAHSVHHIGETFEEAGAMCLHAGMDIEMPSCTGYNEKLKRCFKWKLDIHIWIQRFCGFWRENSEWAYLKIPMRWKEKSFMLL